MKKLITKLVVASVVLAFCLPTYGEILVYKVSGTGKAVVDGTMEKVKVKGYLVADVDFGTDTIDNSALILYDTRNKVYQTIDDVFDILLTNGMVAAELRFAGAEAIVIGKAKEQDIGNGDQNVAKSLKGNLLIDGYLPLSDEEGYGSGTIGAKLDPKRTKTANEGGSMTFSEVVADTETYLAGKGCTQEDFGDTTPPTPDPMIWETEPDAISDTQIIMTATEATASDVEYYFTNQTVYYHNSGWQSSRVYVDSGLDPETQYCYTVRARDDAENETADSDPCCATTEAVPDTTAPTPDPMTWATGGEPNALGTTDSISMTATDACDVSLVEYYFTNLTDANGDSGWQDDPNYTDTGLDPNTQYCYMVKARDKSPNQNATADSNSACATTDVPDTTPPSPDPMEWATGGEPNAISDSEITMTAKTATDAHPVLYYFTCVTDANFDSGWQGGSGETYTATGLAPATTYEFNVRAKDSIGNTTAPSSPNEPAKTFTDSTNPSPDPMTWETVPYATGATSIKMKATTATDASGPVEYQFWYTAGGILEARGWGTDPNFEDKVNENTTYGYKVRARDALHNMTDYSTAETAQTPKSIQTLIDEAIATRAGPPFYPITVTVPEGTYVEDLVIYEPNITLESASDVTIQLATAGVGIRITADGCTLGGSPGRGFTILPDTVNTGIVIMVSDMGGLDDVEISHNVIDCNGNAFEVIEVVSVGTNENLDISHNIITLNNDFDFAIWLAGPIKDLIVNDNIITSLSTTADAFSVIFDEVPVEGATISNNTITGATSEIWLGANNMNDILYTGNDFIDTQGAILVDETTEDAGADRLTNLDISNNTFGTGSPTTMDSFGFLIVPNCEDGDIDWNTVQLRNNTFQVCQRLGATHSFASCSNGVGGPGQLDAVHNWWNAADGPGTNVPAETVIPSVGCGSGDGVSTAVDYEPFWTNAAMTTDANCPVP